VLKGEVMVLGCREMHRTLREGVLREDGSEADRRITLL